MGMTMTQKILAAHAGLDHVEAGQLIEADLDLVLGNDITSPVAIHEMDKMTVDTVFNKDKIALVMDHFIPNKDIIYNIDEDIDYLEKKGLTISKSSKIDEFKVVKVIYE